MDSFIEKFGGSISSTLECFDRVIFKGHLPFQNEARLNGFVDHVLKIRRKDFLKLLERHSNDLVAHGKALAEAAGRPYEYKQGFFRKEALIDDIIRRDRLTEGLVAVLCVQETCKTGRLVHAQGRPVLVHARRPQRVLYFYYLDRDFGLMYVRIQSWFPYTVQVYVNGHSWVARQMTSRRMAFIQHDNAFTSIDSPTKATFTHQWLDVDRLDFFRFDHQLYPEFDESTREVAKGEIYHTFHTLLAENLDARKLLKNDFVVINGLLATYYGIDDAGRPLQGMHYRKIALPAASPRGGLLGMAAVLGMGSNGERTSPVERGVWVLRKLLNDPPPPAPPNVPQLSRLDAQKINTRERMRMHQEEPQCAQCHRVIDPIGFGLENFDAGGKWRTDEHAFRSGSVIKDGPVGKIVDATFPIDPAGSFHNGPAFKDFFELRDLIAARGDDFLRGLIENLYAYALGRPVSFADTDTINGLVARAKADGGGLASIIQSIVATPEFRTK